METAALQSLFSDPDVIRDLQQLHGGITLSLIDLSPGRAQVVQKLNSAGISVAAWLALPGQQGYYLNASNAAQAEVRFTEFQKWTADSGLRWSSIGLDIEPNLQEFTSISRTASAALKRLFDPDTVTRARTAYGAFIARIKAAGYSVETYQFPFIADEREVRSTLLERLFGIVDVRGDREVLMLYSSFNRAADSALIEAARREGKVTWYTTLIVNQAIRPLQQAFEQKYPGVRLEYSRADDSPTALKILTEARAGRVQADILDGLYNMVALRRAGLIAPYRPPNVDQYSPALRDADGYWIAILIYVFTPGVNTNLVPLAEAPTTLRDLLDPRWRGQMAWNPNSIAGAPGFPRCTPPR